MTEQKPTAQQYLAAILEEERQQTRKLKSINTVVQLFGVLVVISLALGAATFFCGLASL